LTVQLLAIGAHPDDIEIGAAALLTKALQHGIDTHFLILTDESDCRAARRAEAVLAARSLGVPQDRVIFAGLEDGQLRVDRTSVSRVREKAGAHGLRPDIVVTHTLADSHNDHVEANRIAHAAFRKCVFLHFSTYLSSERERFAPRVFIAVSGAKLEKKTAALAAYSSQQNRLARSDLADYEGRMGALARLDRAESFEVSRQEGADGLMEEVLALSESPFHRFWTRIAGSKGITLFYEAYAVPGAAIDWPSSHANTGRDRLRQAFRDQWLPSSPLRETGSGSSSVQQILESQSVILAGGAVSNLIVRDVYNRFRTTVWSIDYEMPRLGPAYLCNRSTQARMCPRYDAAGNTVQDFGVLARVANPYAPGEHVVCAAGASGFGTRVALEFLADPGAQPEVMKHFETRENVQVAFSARPDAHGMEVLDVCRD
jgi:LmbE family N-acetylglucosaminyl deacetylase